MEYDFEENEEELVGQHVSGMTQIDDTKELKIDGCNYEISEPELRKWLEMNGVITSSIKEVAIPVSKREAQLE